MTAALIVSIVLGFGGSLTAVITAWFTIRDRRQAREKKTGEIRLDKVSYDEIASRAAKINSDERIEIERWWKEQFDAVKLELRETRVELEREKNARRKVTKWAKQHQQWDQDAYQLALHTDVNYPPPPLLDENGVDY